MAVGPEHEEGANTTDGLKLPLWIGAALTLLHVPLMRCFEVWACLQRARGALLAIHRLHFSQARPFSSKLNVFLRWKQSLSKSSSLSSCIFIPSFLFIVKIPERAICSHRHSVWCLSGMSGHPLPPWETCTSVSSSLSFCTHPVLGTACPPAMPKQ